STDRIRRNGDGGSKAQAPERGGSRDPTEGLPLPDRSAHQASLSAACPPPGSLPRNPPPQTTFASPLRRRRLSVGAGSKRLQGDPFASLNDVLERLSTHPIDRHAELCPTPSASS